MWHWTWQGRIPSDKVKHKYMERQQWLSYFHKDTKDTESSIIPLFSLRRFSNSLGFNSSGAEHEHLRIQIAES